MAKGRKVTSGDEARRAIDQFATSVRAAIKQEASVQVRTAQERASRAEAAVDPDTYTVRLTTNQLNEFGQEAARAAGLQRRVKLFKDYTPEAYGEKVKDWTTTICENEERKLEAALVARAQAEAFKNENADDSGEYERVTAADLADSPETEEADEAEEYVLECNAPPEKPKVSKFQEQLGRIALDSVQEVVAMRQGKEQEDTANIPVGGVLVLTLEIKADGQVSVAGIQSRNGFEYNSNMSTIRAELNHRLGGMKVDSLPVGNRVYVVDFNSTVETTPQRPPVAQIVS